MTESHCDDCGTPTDPDDLNEWDDGSMLCDVCWQIREEEEAP